MLDTLKRGVTYPVRTVRTIRFGYDPFDPEMVLEAAAGLLEREGWIQGEDYRKGFGYCTVGAINKMAGDDDVYCDATILIGEYLGVGSVPDWNDEPGRSAGEVTDALRNAAHLRRQA